RLAVVSGVSVFAPKMFVQKCTRNWLCSVFYGDGQICHAGHALEDHRMMGSFGGILAPTKRCVPRYQHRRHLLRITATERTLDCNAVIGLLVLRHCGVAQRLRYRHVTTKVVGVRSPEAWDRYSCLSPRGRIFRMSVDHTADLWKRTIQHEVGWQI